MALSEDRVRFLDWLTEVRAEGETQSSFAAVLGVDPARLSEWKKEPEFLRLWEDRMRERYGHPERLAKQLDNLHRIASGEDHDARPSDQIKATSTYWALLGKNAPARSQMQVQALGAGDVRALTDQELAAAVSRVEALNAGDPDDVVVDAEVV